jgi:Ca-activated chloride channel family protein
MKALFFSTTMQALIMVGAFVLSSAMASPGRALKDYEKGQYNSARQEYQRLLERKPDDSRLLYNAGTADYQAREYDAAARHLTNALAAPDLKLQEQAFYNLGNTFYRLGEKTSDPNAKIQTWEQSLQSYESALKLNEQDADAKFNKELVKKRLEELKKEQQQNQQKKPDQDKNQKQDKDKNKEQNQDKQDKQDKQDSSKQPEQQSNQNKQDQSGNKDQQTKDPQPKQPPPPQKDHPTQSDPSSNPADEKGDEQVSEAPAKPGQMTRQQAQQLLDNQKNDEKALLLLPPEPRQQRGRSFKNW